MPFLVGVVLAVKPRCPLRAFSHQTASLLCGLRELCAMPFLVGVVLAVKPRCPLRAFSHQAASLLCGLRDLCAMLSSFLLRRDSRPEAAVSTAPFS